MTDEPTIISCCMCGYGEEENGTGAPFYRGKTGATICEKCVIAAKRIFDQAMKKAIGGMR